MVLLVAAITLAVGIGAETAYGYFTSSGSGSGSASAGTMQTVTVAALVGGDSPTSTLLPGGPTAEVILRVNNPNSYSVTLTSVAPNGTITASGGIGPCTTTGVSFIAPSGPNITVNPGSDLIDLPGAASMSTSSSSGCQGAIFSIPVTITAHKG